jgi:hypothetical protein
MFDCFSAYSLNTWLNGCGGRLNCCCRSKEPQGASLLRFRDLSMTEVADVRRAAQAEPLLDLMIFFVLCNRAW